MKLTMTRLLAVIALLLGIISIESHAQTLNEQDDRTDWKFCQTCANSNPSTNKAGAVLDTHIVATPSIDGTARQFSVQALAPYANGYWWLEQPVQYVASKHIVMAFQLYVSKADLAASQAIEFEFQQTVGGKTFNYALQANFLSGCWKTFDYATKQWQKPLLCAPTTLKPDAFNHIYYEGVRGDTSLVINYLNVNGVRYNINAFHLAALTGRPNHFTSAFQLDSKGTMVPYKVVMDKLRLYIY